MSLDAGTVKESLKTVSAQAVLALFYFASGKLGLALAIVNPSATAVWPPTGIALAALLVLGYRCWPAIFVGAFLVNITTSGSPSASLMIAGGNTLEALVGAYLVNRYANGRLAFERAQNIFRFILFSGLISTTISAMVGVGSLLLNGLVQLSEVSRVWLTWWLGNAAGALIVAPVLILWANFIRDRNRTQVLEAILLMLSLVVVGLVVFSDMSPIGIQGYPIYFLILPVVVWFAFRLGPPETATAILFLAAIAIAGTISGSGPFSRFAANEALLLLQGYMSIVAITFLSLAAVIAERRRTEQALAQSEHKYNSVVETAHDVVVTINEHSEILYINAVAEKLFGYRVAEMIGQNLAMLMPERLRARHLTSFGDYLRTGQRHISWDNVELLGRHKDGHEIPLEVSFGESTQGAVRLFTGVMRDVTSRKQAEESSRWLATLVESSDDAVIGKTLDGVVLSWNRGAEKIYGYTAEEMIGRPISVLVPPDRLDEMPKVLGLIRSGEEIPRFETERIRKDGQRIFVALTISPVRDATGAIRGASTVARDITDRKRAELALRRSQSFLIQAQEIGGIGSWVSSLGPDKHLWWSRESYFIFGIADGTAIDNDTFFGIVHPDDRARVQEAVQQAIAERRAYTIDHRIVLRDGTERWVTERADITYDEFDRPVNLVGVVQDITERKHTEHTIQRLAYVDTLTDLPNRASLLQRLKNAIDAVRADHQRLGLMLINIKDFRDINDTLGHENGDRFLVEVATRLRNALWDSDTIARLTGDEFAVLLPRLARPDDIELVVRKTIEALKPVITIAGVPLEVRPAIGIALFPEHGDDASMLYQHADVALNTSKMKHQPYTIYDTTLDVYDPQRLSLIAELRAAIATDQLQLFYQPRIDFHTRSLVGVEALVRWQHPKRGLISPDEFVPAAEKTGLIDELTQWVLRTAMHQGMHWYAQGLTLEMAVNISAHSLRKTFLVSMVKHLLEQTAYAPYRLILEVTESAIMLDPVNAMNELKAVRKLGVQFAIDDFGVGYSSLSYLRQLPVSHLKIDKSFIADMRDPKNSAIVRGTVELAHSLELSVTAEGVEDKATYTTLKLLGCDQAQGYYISRALPAEALDAWLAKSRWKLKAALATRR